MQHVHGGVHVHQAGADDRDVAARVGAQVLLQQEQPPLYLPRRLLHPSALHSIVGHFAGLRAKGWSREAGLLNDQQGEGVMSGG